jgi:hypothetical protein
VLSVEGEDEDAVNRTSQLIAKELGASFTPLES